MQNKILHKFFFLFSVLCCSMFEQTQAQYYIGYPSYLDSIGNNAKVILNKIPGTGDRYFNTETLNYFEKMCQFMESHPEYKCNIYLYDFESTGFEKRLAWTTLQAQRVKTFLLANDTLCDFSFINSIIPNGEENPIFKNLNISDTTKGLNKQDCYFLKQSIILELIRDQ